MIDLITAALLPIFLIIALGYLAGYTGKIDNKQLLSLNTVVMDFALPAAMFDAVVKASRSQLLGQWVLVLILAVGLALFWLILYLLARKLFGQPPAASALLAMTVGLPNYAAAGLPLMDAVFGDRGHLPTVIGIALGAIVLVPLTLITIDLSRARQEDRTGSPAAAVLNAVRRAARSPLILAPILAVFFVFLDLRIPRPIELSLDLLGKAAAAVALLVTGLVLSAQRPRLTAKVAAAVLIANLGHPALSWLLAKLLPSPQGITHEAILLSALPTGFFGILFALRYGEDVAESGSVVAFSTISSVVTLSFFIAATRHMR